MADEAHVAMGWIRRPEKAKGFGVTVQLTLMVDTLAIVM